MNLPKSVATQCALLFGGFVLFSGLCGCQTNVGGQTLPSAYYLRDDIQFFPAGPEFLLPETVRAHEEYRASQMAAADEGYLPNP